jgi:hypothetical protein
MREFNLQEAKEGKPVCTRDGHKARIICFDRKNSEYPIVALITCNNKEDCVPYTIDGKFVYGRSNKPSDLVMAPIKKVGWLNIYEDIRVPRRCGCLWDTKEEALAHKEKYYTTTIKVEWEE